MGFYKSQIQGFLTLFLRLQVYNFMRINIYFTLRKIYKCICNCTFSSRINQELTTNNNRTSYLLGILFLELLTCWKLRHLKLCVWGKLYGY